MVSLAFCEILVLILDGNSEIAAYVRGNLCFDLSKALDREPSHIGFISPKRPRFLHVCATCSELPSNISTMYGIVKLNETTWGGGKDNSRALPSL